MTVARVEGTTSFRLAERSALFTAPDGIIRLNTPSAAIRRRSRRALPHGPDAHAGRRRGGDVHEWVLVQNFAEELKRVVRDQARRLPV